MTRTFSRGDADDSIRREQRGAKADPGAQLTKADTVALWHAVQWITLCLKQSEPGEPGLEAERERLTAAKRALRKVNAIRSAAASRAGAVAVGLHRTERQG
jgi:hypothetical protein